MHFTLSNEYVRKYIQETNKIKRMTNNTNYPDAIDSVLVGSYPAQSKSGGGYVWDEVLEYRVWCHPSEDDPESEDGSDYYYAFASYAEACECSEQADGAEKPLALVLQREYIDEPDDGVYIHVKEARITEWPVVFLSRPRRTACTIPDFLAPDAPPNRLDILRGIAKP